MPKFKHADTHDLADATKSANKSKVVALKEPRSTAKRPANTKPPRTNVRNTDIARWAKAVETAGHRQGKTRAEVADYLGIAVGYFNVLLAGGGETQKVIGRELIERSAELLGVSIFSASVQAGMNRITDLFHTTDFETDLDYVYDRMASDSDLGAGMMTLEQWKSLPHKVRYHLALTANKAYEKTLVQKIEILTAE